MTRNPYAHPIDPILDDRPQRVSGLAVASLVFGLLCCIPGSGLLGVILGGAGLIGIGRSDGRLTGRGMAVGGIVLGLIGTVLYLGVLVGVSQAVGQMGVYGRVVESAQARDRAAVRSMLAPSISSAVSDDQIDEFGQKVTDRWGAYRGMPRGLLDWFGAYAEVGQQLQRINVGPGQSSRTAPLPVRFDKGTALVVFTITRSPSPSGAAQVSQIEVIAPDGSSISLVGQNPQSLPSPGNGPRPQAPSNGTGATGDPISTGEPAGTG